MFLNRTKSGRANIVGVNIAKLRKGMKISQRELSDRLNEAGLAIDKNAVQRMECGLRFITDIELQYIAEVFSVSIPELYKSDAPETEINHEPVNR